MGLLTSCFVLGGAFSYTMTVLMGGFSPFESCPGGFILGRWLMMKVIDALVRDVMVMSSSMVLSGIFCLGGGGEVDPEKKF